MKLYIAEKKEVAAAISSALGGPNRPEGAAYIAPGDIKITWLWGHLLELCDPEDCDPEAKKWDLSKLPMTWPIQYKPVERHKEHLGKVVELAKQADEIVHAGDPDAEGQRLVDEVIEYAGLTGKPCGRVLINDNTDAAIRQAIAKEQDNTTYAGLSNSALARAVCDQRYGYNLTRLYTLLARQAGHDGMLSVGRVQTPILGLVVRRDRAHEGHTKQAYYKVEATLSGLDKEIKAAYVPATDAPVDDKGRIIDAGFAATIVAACKGQAAEILEANTKDKERNAPLPYNLLALQADAAQKWGYKPKEVLEISQKLRDEHKAITYNRSDCRYLNDDRHAEAPALLAALGKVFSSAQAADATRKSKAFDSGKVGAHHAIIPTLSVPDTERLPESARNIYKLIVRNYIAQFYPPETWRGTELKWDIAGHTFRSTGRVDTAAGWRVLFGNEAADPDADAVDNLESYKAGDSAQVKEVGAKEEHTKPLPYYTMSTLLKDLAQVAKYVSDPKIKALLLDKDKDKESESGGIGTPATRDSLIDTLFRRGFLAEKGKAVISTDLGRQFYDQLPPLATAPDLTALWHEQQREIELNKKSAAELIESVDQIVAAEVARAKSSGLGGLEVAGVTCPVCAKGVLRKRKGKTGAFWGCSAYPECKATYPDNRNKPDLKAREVSKEHTCPDCGKPLIRRQSVKKKGAYWWGCSGFPACNYRTFDNFGKPVSKVA